MAKYFLTAKTQNKISTYGIKYGDKINIYDITPDKELLQKLIDKINSYDLSPCHLEQVIEDFLIDYTID